MLPRFFVDPAAIAAGEAVLDRGERDHAVRVLRLAPGDQALLFDGKGLEYPARVVESSRKRVRFSVVASRPAAADPGRAKVALLQGLPRLSRMDWLVEKATEAGVSRILPLLARRSPPEARRAAGRLARWQMIAREACRQCGRARVPEIDPPIESEAGWRHLAAAPASRAILDPGARRVLGDWLAGSAGEEWALAVGPEGGWEEEELGRAREAGFEPVGLGPRVLRAETAGVVAVAAVQLLRGDLRGPEPAR